MKTSHIATIASAHGRPIHFYDGGSGPLFILRDSMGIVGVVRASTWEEAYEAAEDELYPEADETWEEIARDLGCDPEKLLDDACFHEQYGFRPNGANARDKRGHGIYQKDLNGDHLDTLTDKMIERYGLIITYHPHISTTYEIVDEESAREGEVRERGWHDEEGESMTPDKWEEEDGMTVASKAIEWLRDKGAVHASSSQFHPGVWYSTDLEQDFQVGDWTTYSYHLKGFTEADQRTIFYAIVKGT